MLPDPLAPAGPIAAARPTEGGLSTTGLTDRRERGRLRRQAERYRLMADPTRLAILEALSDGPREVAELARATGVHRNTVRSHLAKLDAAGLLASETSEPLGRGRPSLRYRLREQLPLGGPEYRVLIQSLLVLLERAYQGDATAAGEAEGHRVGVELGGRVRVGTPEAAVRKVVEVLQLLSFDPQLTRREPGYEIALYACPFSVRNGDPQGRIVCAFHLGLMRGVTDAVGGHGRQHVELFPFQRPEACVAQVAVGGA